MYVHTIQKNNDIHLKASECKYYSSVMAVSKQAIAQQPYSREKKKLRKKGRKV